MLEVSKKRKCYTNMTYKEYKNIIEYSLLEYCKNGGSLVYLALNDLKKEYIFTFDESLSENEKMKLINRSRKAIILGKDLPPNIKLEKVLIE